MKKFINFINNIGDVLTESLRAFTSAYVDIVKLNADSVYVILVDALIQRLVVLIFGSRR